MKSFTQKLLLALFTLTAFAIGSVQGQSILNPADSVYAYDSTKPVGNVHNPTYTSGVINKWIRTPKMNWNTNPWKCYIYNNIPFRLIYPKSYNPTANDGKLYPIIIFYHGAGEFGPKTDNETSLANGGQQFTNAVANGTFDGYILVMQSPYVYWDVTFLGLAASITDYMVANNKLDRFRISVNGLSAGGQATWAMLLGYPNYVAADLPMSANNTGNSTPSNLKNTRFTPIWTFSGGQDNDPDPGTAATINTQELAAGADYLYTLYPTLGHDTWDAAWAERNFYPYCLAAYMSNPWALGNHTSFCQGTTIKNTIGVAPQFTAYQWRKNGVLISGAITDTLAITDTGTYDCRVEKGTTWSDWSRTPVRISWQTPTVPPTITVSGLMSKVIPALDNNYVNIKVPSGYGTYVWQKVGSSTTIGTDSVLKVTSPGNYVVQVTQQFGCTSAFSAPFTVVSATGTPKPDAASGLTAQALSNTSVVLNWNQNPTPQVNETNFEVYQGTQSGGPYKLIAITGQDVAADTVSGLSAGTKYYYVVRPVNGTGAAANTNEASVGTPSDTQPPVSPAGLAVTNTSYTSITITWNTATDNVGVVGYDIYVDGAKAYTVPAPDTTFTIYSLVHQQNYAISVKARDLAGNVSPASNQVTGQPLINGLTYSYYNNLSASISVLPNFPTLTPTKTGSMPNVSIAGATDANDFSYLWTGYIFIPTTGTYTFQTSSDDGSALWIGSLNSKTSPYSFTGTPTVNNNFLQGTTSRNSSAMTLTAGIYPIAIAYFQQGGGTAMTIAWQTPSSGGSFVTIPNSAFSETAIVGGTAPAYPTNTTATAVNYDSVRVNWTDNSSNETGFEVYRSSTLNGPYTIITTTKANATSYIDTGLVASTTYYYRIQAVNIYGGSGYDPNSLSGLSYNYYNGFTASNLSTLPSLTPTSTGFLTNVSLSPATSTTNFAFKFSGYINIKTAGSYTFYTSSDDGSDMYVGGFDSAHLLVQNDFLQGQTQRSGTKTLAVGRYPIYVTYFQQGGGDALVTSWKLGSAAVTAIPDSAFYGLPAKATTLVLPTIPAAPTGLTATALSSSSVQVAWVDNATNETGYTLYRSANTDQNYVLLANLAANSVSYTDTGLFSNATYFYKVKASNAGGSSAYAAESSTRTLDLKPVIVKLASQQVRYGTTATIALKATSAAGSALTLTGLNLPSFVTIHDNGNGTGSLTVSPTAANAGTYSIGAVAADAFGGSDTTLFSLAVNNNFAPTLDSVGNVSMSEGDTLTLTLNGHNVNPADTLTIAVSGLPTAYTLTQVSNGTATLFLHPSYAAAGTYAVVVTVNDKSGYSATRTFTMTVAYKNPVTHIYARVQAVNAAPAPWNNLTGPTTNGLKDQNGVTTSVGMSFTPSSWWNPYGYGGTNTGNNSGVYPDVVLEEYYYFNYFGGPVNPSVIVTGLDKTKTYDLTFMGASTFSYFANNGSTQYTVGSQSVSLAVQGNTQNTVTLSSLAPAADGTITVSMLSLTSAPGYLNSLVIANHFNDSTAPAQPGNLQAQVASGKGVSLTWTDVAYNENSYAVYRSTPDSLHFTQITSLPANSTTYTDTSVSGSKQYYYKVNATNAFGVSPYSNTATLLTADRVPTVNPISNVTVSNTSSAQVNVTAVDDPTDHLTLTASGLPAFASFVDNGNGTGVITVSPMVGLQGSYPGVTITATDGSDSSRSTSFTINVVDPNLRYTYVNITSYSNAAPAPWNNFFISYLPTAGLYANGLTDQAGASTGYTVTLTDAWSGVSVTGMKRRNGSDLYPETVEANGVYATDNNNRRITVTGLNPSKAYNFQFFTSHNTSESTLTNFTINGVTTSLNGDYNSNKTTEINDVVSDGTGTVVINCQKDASAVYAMVSSIVIEEYTPGNTAPFSPADLRTLDYAKSGSVSLQWQDRAGNETGYQVWRANDGGSYSLLATLAANSTSYSDTALPTNTAYDYVVRAVNGTQYSAYSNPVRGYTYSGAVFINTDGSDGGTAGAPWNQTKWVNQTVGNVWNNFMDETGYTTNVGLIQDTKWDAVNNHGVSTGNNSGIFPDAVMGESFANFIGDTSMVTLSGLDQTKTYDLTFFGSCTDDGTQNSTTEYTINGHTVMLNAHKNSSGTVTMFGVVPDQNGNINVTVDAYDSSNSSYSVLTVMIVKGYTPSTATVSKAPTEENPIGASTGMGAEFATGAADSVTEKPLSAYPNPFDQSFSLTVPAHSGDNILVTITDVSGRTVYKTEYENLYEGTNLFQIQTDSRMTPGVYFVNVIYTNRDERQLLKVIKR